MSLYHTQQFTLKDLSAFRQQVLHWAAQHDVCCYLDNNGYHQNKYQTFDVLIAVGVHRELSVTATGNAFAALRHFHQRQWLFGHLCYDLKNEVERLTSENHDGLGFPMLYFFQPETIIEIKEATIIIHTITHTPKKILAAIRQLTPTASSPILSDIQIQARVPKSEYLQNVAAIQQHIIEGDLYEMNYCQEFYAEQAEITPITLFEQLNNLTQSPFAAFYKNRQQYVLCASPERFIKKIGRKIISQPIKGTMRRGSSNAEDAWLQQALANSEKDRAENVMIVDLVRNDFARSCQSGSVQVEELFGIYTFRQVHQMISTISGTLRKNVSWVTAIRNAFPMGSMTGAPKVMAMQLIEQYEASKRGLYSGAIGYITPRGNFDFNVVIRSLLYNAANRYLSFQVGGAIVYDSEPEKEYEECLLKASAIMRVLQNER